jgi:hypothetical protein
MSLVEHAKRELEFAGLFSKDSDYEGMLGEAVLELVEKFAQQGHSGFSAGMTLRIFNQVARFKPLGPVTDNPDEWMEVGEDKGLGTCRQNRRQSSCFSYDGGKTYYDIDEKVPVWRRAFRWTGTLWSRRAPTRKAAKANSIA